MKNTDCFIFSSSSFFFFFFFFLFCRALQQLGNFTRYFQVYLVTSRTQTDPVWAQNGKMTCPLILTVAITVASSACDPCLVPWLHQYVLNNLEKSYFRALTRQSHQYRFSFTILLGGKHSKTFSLSFKIFLDSFCHNTIQDDLKTINQCETIIKFLK